MTVDPISSVVVGYDGSPASCAALTWAARLCARVGARVHIVHAVGLLEGAQADTDSDAHRDRALQWAHDAGLAASQVDWSVLDGDPCSVLLRTSTSKPTDLVVVGTRGAGGHSGLLLGSTSLELVEHSTIPVVIVPSAAPGRHVTRRLMRARWMDAAPQSCQ